MGCDVHLSKGLECVDCHTSIDVHGDGNIYPTTDHAVEIECTDCHGTAEAYPWELPKDMGTHSFSALKNLAAFTKMQAMNIS